jgi:hypothetical protein
LARHARANAATAAGESQSAFTTRRLLETALGAGLAKQVLGNLEASCRLGWCQQAIVGAVLQRGLVTDHRLTKILVLA